MSFEIRLTRLTGPEKDSVLTFRKPVLRLGTLEENDVRFGPEEAGRVAPVHAKIVLTDGRAVLYDNEDDYGTYVNGARVDTAELKPADEIRFGDGGPALRFDADLPVPVPRSRETMVRLAPTVARKVGDVDQALEALAMRKAREFPLAGEVRIGRDPRNELVLDHPQVSAFHARIAGGRIEDLRSRNGTYVNRSRVSRGELRARDSIQIGPYVILFHPDRLQVYDETRRAEVAAERVSVRLPGGPLLLDDVTLRIGTGELVGILGPSGAGKSTLLKALCGLRPPSGGSVRLNDLDLYRNYESLKQNIGYVPQDDIVHPELEPKRTFEYVARLRLPADLRAEEREARIRTLTTLLELRGQENTPVRRLSGGQRKRVSLGVELLTEPQLIYLDEPTAGLDPALESKMMVLFKELSRQGRTVVVTTHLMENVDLFDKLIVLARGRLAFFGTPAEAREYFDIADLRGLFTRLGHRTPEEWRDRYRASPLAPVHGAVPLAGSAATAPAVRRRTRIGGLWAALRQLGVLSRRYVDILLRDRRNVAILLLQAPVVAVFIAVAMDKVAMILFMLTLAAIWFGTSNAAKEIVKELPIYRRERMFNLGVVPYVFSKVLVLSAIALAQSVLLVGVMALLRRPEGSLALLVGSVWLTAVTGLLLGLLVSTLVGTTDKAVSAVPLLLIPQVLFAGAITSLTGRTGAVSTIMPSRWSYDLLKRGVMETHRGPTPPLVASAAKDLHEKELARLEAESRILLVRIDESVERFVESRNRMEAQWRVMDLEVRRMEEHDRAIRGSYDRIRMDYVRLETRRRELEMSLARQKEALREFAEDAAGIQRDLESRPPRPDRILERLTPEWLEKRKKQLEEMNAAYRRVEATAAEVRQSQERLGREFDMIGARMQDASRSSAILRAGKGAMEQEVASLRGLVEESIRLEKTLKARADRMRELQDELMQNLRHGRFVFLDPADSMRKDALMLAAFCACFLVAVCLLQARRDREG